MKAMILAAGRGIRLRPLTWTLPKPMLPVGGRPLLEHHIELLRAHGVTDITINLHHKPEVIREHLGDGSGLGARITYSYEKSLLGSAGAIKKVESTFDRPFYILYGDVLLDLDLTAFSSFHRARGAALTMAVYPTEEPTRCGIAMMDDDGRVRRFREKPAAHEVFSAWASAGAFVAEPEVLLFIPRHTPFDIGGDLIPRLIDLGWPVYGFAREAYFLDIGSPERYQQAQRDMEQGRVRTPVAVQAGRATAIAASPREVGHAAR